MKNALLMVLGLSLAAAGPALAEVYRWVDEQGRVHYGDKPSGQAEQVELRQSPGAGKGSAARREQEQRLLDAWAEERRQRQAVQAKAEAEQARRARNCGVARDRLRTYRRAGYLYDYDDEGRRRVLNDAGRAEAEREAAAAVERWCD